MQRLAPTQPLSEERSFTARVHKQPQHRLIDYVLCFPFEVDPRCRKLNTAIIAYCKISERLSHVLGRNDSIPT